MTAAQCLRRKIADRRYDLACERYTEAAGRVTMLEVESRYSGGVTPAQIEAAEDEASRALRIADEALAALEASK